VRLSAPAQGTFAKTALSFGAPHQFPEEARHTFFALTSDEQSPFTPLGAWRR